jgi:glycosyltransferase involved in cell wall biosynthesis
MLIDFVHTGDAYLPELQAYMAFIQAAGHQAKVHRHVDTVPRDAAVLWWMCGQVSTALAQRYPGAFHIHEYASSSVPPWAWLKDRVKRVRQAVPQYRIFQNDWVRERMGFDDALPYEFRDMGLAPEFFDSLTPRATPEFDFVYLGEMRRLQHFFPLFGALAQAATSVLLVGEIGAELQRNLPQQGRLTVTGRVPHGEVPAQLRRARYGLNLVPDQLPYTRQTSTKLLEYCAAGLPVLSTDYPWVRAFEQQHAARFAYLPFGASAGAYRTHLEPALARQNCVVPDVRALAWPHLLAGLQIWRQLGLYA